MHFSFISFSKTKIHTRFLTFSLWQRSRFKISKLKKNNADLALIFDLDFHVDFVLIWAPHFPRKFAQTHKKFLWHHNLHIGRCWRRLAPAKFETLLSLLASFFFVVFPPQPLEMLWRHQDRQQSQAKLFPGVAPQFCLLFASNKILIVIYFYLI